jgi:hypothetical protein
MGDQHDQAAERTRRLRIRRWVKLVHAFVLAALVVMIPLGVAVLLSDDESSSSTSTAETSEVLIRSFDGSGDQATGVFVVATDWVLVWELDGLASETIEIVVRSSTGEEIETLTQEGLGQGRREFSGAGAYRLAVSSSGDWRIRVLGISGAGEANS